MRVAVRLVVLALAGAAAGISGDPALAAAPPADAPKLDGAGLSLLWTLPFAAILGSIALLPLVAAGLWHHHYGKIAALCALAFVLPCAIVFGWRTALYELVHTLLQEYIPFVVLLLALFTVAGGVRVRGEIVGTPLTNTAILGIGTLLASLMGTTGASMLLVHPLIRANAWRRRNVHVFVFFIFLVGNIGGALTPLGDPPLFIGFLEGVSFFWVTTRMFLPMAVVALPLLAMFYALDSWHWRRETPPSRPARAEPFGIDGKRNLALLALIVAAVLMSGVWRPGWGVRVFHTLVEIEDLARSILLLAIAGLSWKITRRENRALNQFTWAPMVEVAKLFFAIFITIVPAIAIIRAGDQGAARDLLALLNHGGSPDNVMYFWVTGALSSFLDNAPTYLLFFNLAGGDEVRLMGPLATTLLAISAGAVFMGANTYIGNAPNFMIKAVVEDRGLRMPSFFGFMAWSGLLLLPLFGLVTILFFA
ncbi:MAG: sodium:proton antiporter [Alphaproteobacteria bacterium]|nr:sodium:proton antiporter [Alphaproteobacteria bacterium]